MSTLNQAPDASRTQIGIFGKVNAGKSTLLNILTGQDMAVVSEVAGTTTDPVKKSMEILPIGPVTIYDTPGFADEGTLGQKRMEKTDIISRRIDIAVIVVDASEADIDLTEERDIIRRLSAYGGRFLVVANKCDLISHEEAEEHIGQIAESLEVPKDSILRFSSKQELKKASVIIREAIADIHRKSGNSPDTEKHLVSDLVEPGEVVILVIPIDESAPKGRIILPQQQVIRDLLDHNVMVMSVQPSELAAAVASLNKSPALVITDSQAFKEVDEILSDDIPLTSFSILMSRFKGDLEWQAQGASALDDLKEGASILISEGCTHHRQCGDIGTVKLPNWIREKTGKEFDYHFTSGGEFPAKLDDYDLIIHCGGCTLPPREMAYRIGIAKEAGVPITNYGTMIAALHGILPRALRPITGG